MCASRGNGRNDGTDFKLGACEFCHSHAEKSTCKSDELLFSDEMNELSDECINLLRIGIRL